ncbi:hypothetical protein [Aquipuribacter sp. MA13-6]|uniref:hypothetical protein n=1 Tax=unclassified Aquipuribacter TaxID=2635084 RepID=UPI003EEC5A58
MSSSIVAGVLAAAGETGTEMAQIELPIPVLGFGIITFVTFMALLAITYAFKNVAARR